MRRLFYHIISFLLLFNGTYSTSEAQRPYPAGYWTQRYNKFQNGNLFISNFHPGKNYETQYWDIAEAHDQSIMVANPRGILVYDGYKWDLIQIPGIPYSLCRDYEKNIVYVGSDDGFGYLKKDENGRFIYHSLLNIDLSFGKISKIKLNKENIFVYSDQTITIFNRKDFTIKTRWKANNLKRYAGLFTFNKKIFINIKGKGLNEINQNVSQLIEGTEKIGQTEILFSIPYFLDHVLIGTNDNKLYLFDGEKITPYFLKDQKFINGSILSCGINLSDTEFAIGTLSGGCLIISKKSGKTINTINYQTGLPDDEIYAMGVDHNVGLWLAHEAGLSRVNFSFPITNFNSYPGIEGSINAVSTIDSTLYVATNEGVFYLSNVRSFNEIKPYLKIKSHLQADANKTYPLTFKQRWKQTKSIWGFGRKHRKKKINNKQFKQIYATHSLKKIFKKVKGLDSKCKQLIKFKNRLLVASNTGLYEIKNKKVSTIEKGRYISYIAPSSLNGKFYVGSNEGIFSITYEDDLKNWFIQPIIEMDERQKAHSIIENGHYLWIGSRNTAFRISLTGHDFTSYEFKNKQKTSEKVVVRKHNDKIYFFLNSGIYSYHSKADTILEDNKLTNKFNKSSNFIYSQKDFTWLLNNDENIGFHKNKTLKNKHLNIFKDIQDIHVDKQENIWIVNGSNSLYRIVKETNDEMFQHKFEVFFQKAVCEGENLPLQKLELDYGKSFFDLQISAPFFANPEVTVFQYKIEGITTKWSNWSKSADVKFPFLLPGDYKIKVRARNAIGNISIEKVFTFKVNKPFWQQWWAYILEFLIVAGLVILIIKIREKKLEAARIKLENLVTQRTEEITRQNQEIAEQRDAISKQKEKITQSIQYAKKIQKAVMPPANYLDSILPEHFILYKPKDIVSGDFYWFKKIENKIIIIAADCTGHGVPGAFMSMLGIAFLNEITEKNKEPKANEILNILKQYVKDALRQESQKVETKDGMDLALCIVNLDDKTLQYAGANNPLYIIRNKELKKINADRMPIGVYVKEKSSFTNHEIKLSEGDNIYLFSDGYADQIGEETGRRFMSKAFRNLLLDIHKKDMEEQKLILNRTIEDWKGNQDQMDDMLVIGVKIEN